MRTKLLLLCGALALAVALIVAGVLNGQPRRVMAKADKICIECVGIG